MGLDVCGTGWGYYQLGDNRRCMCTSSMAATLEVMSSIRGFQNFDVFPLQAGGVSFLEQHL